MENNGAKTTKTKNYYLPGEQPTDLMDILFGEDYEVLLTPEEALAEMDRIEQEQAEAEARARFIEDNKQCPRCNGSGDIGRTTILGHSMCLKCYGTGWVPKKGYHNAGASLRAMEDGHKL